MTMRASANTRGDDVAPEDVESEENVEPAPVRSLKYSLMLLGMSLVWAVLLRQFGEGQIYWIMGPYALAISAVLMSKPCSRISGRVARTIALRRSSGFRLGARGGMVPA